MERIITSLFIFSVLIFSFSTPASASLPKVEFDYCADGTIDSTGWMDGAECGSASYNVDIYLTNWNSEHAGNKLFGAKASITITDPVEITVNSFALAGGPWEAFPLSSFVDNGGGSYTIQVASFDCSVPLDGDGKVLIGTMNIQCNTLNVNTTVPITTSALMEDGNAISDAGPSCANPVHFDGGQGQIGIGIASCPCIFLISPSYINVSAEDPGPVTGPAFHVGRSCCNPCDPTPVTYTDDCIYADVDNETGELTVYMTSVSEDCHVTVVDQFPEPCELGDCIADVHIEPPPACDSNINDDRTVNVFDLIILKNEYNRTGCISDNETFCCKADITIDGNVNVFDLIEMKNEYNLSGCIIKNPPCVF